MQEVDDRPRDDAADGAFDDVEQMPRERLVAVIVVVLFGGDRERFTSTQGHMVQIGHKTPPENGKLARVL